MKEGVTYKRLGEVGQVITGSTPPTKDERNYSSNDVCFFKPSDIDSTGLSELNQSEYYISNYAYEHTRKLPKGSILTTCIGIIGKVGILMTDAACNQQINAIIPNADIISSRFLGYAIISIKNSFIQSANAPVVPILTKSLFSNFSIPVPSLSTQELIVRELDSISSVISAKKQQVLELDNLAQAIFLDTFGDPITNPKGWEVKKLGDITSKCNTISWSNVAKDDNYYYVDLSSVVCEIKQIVNPQQVNAASAPSRAKQIILEGDILFGTTRPTQRRVCVVPQKYDSQICSTGFCVLRPKKEIKSEWLFFSLCANRFYEYIEPLQTGANYPAVSDSVVRSYKLPLPPLSLQQAFAEKVQVIEEQKRLINQSIAEFESLLAQRMEFHFA